MPRQLEQPHDADDAEELEDVVVDVQLIEDAVEHERQRRDDVDDVDRFSDEDQLLRTDNEADEDLEGEPGVADAFHVEEGPVRLRGPSLQEPGRLVPTHRDCDVVNGRYSKVRVGFEAEGKDGNDDEENRDEGQDLRCGIGKQRTSKILDTMRYDTSNGFGSSKIYDKEKY